MKMKIPALKPFLISGLALIMAGCGSSPSIVSTPIENIDEIPLKVNKLTETQLQGWGGADLRNDTIPGMSVRKAYQDIIKNKTGRSIIVAVIDSGVDVDHEDLKSVVWINKDEVPNNGIDDDNNGYVDDVHGWNFLGDVVKENLEFTRIYKRWRPRFDGQTAATVTAAEREDFELYQRAKTEYQKEYSETLQNRDQYQQIRRQIVTAHGAVSSQLGKENYTKEELSEMLATTDQMRRYKLMLRQIQDELNESIPAALKELDEALKYFNTRLDYHLNLDFDGRAVLGDNAYNIDNTNYGNHRVSGPEGHKEDVKHGTHVAGIIGANRNNNIGIKGVANNVKIMVLRAVPDGDEYDKDIALAIRYAVDNGAKVINASFGKSFSQYPEWIFDAIRYAAEKDVLIVHAAGNDAVNLDETPVYPNDQLPGESREFVSNFLTVGALNFEYGSGLVAGFSNYGKTTVDVFAPGAEIWSTTPNDQYEFIGGTSMAAPAVAGVAAMIRSYYPNLTAPQVKQIIMDSGLSTIASVIVGGGEKTLKFSEISTSGKMVNMYNALILADKVSNSKS